ncbi:hypothetical protein EV122DRAFT_217114 [Schizophyllum commune]
MPTSPLNIFFAGGVPCVGKSPSLLAGLRGRYRGVVFHGRWGDGERHPAFRQLAPILGRQLIEEEVSAYMEQWVKLGSITVSESARAALFEATLFAYIVHRWADDGVGRLNDKQIGRMANDFCIFAYNLYMIDRNQFVHTIRVIFTPLIALIARSASQTPRLVLRVSCAIYLVQRFVLTRMTGASIPSAGATTKQLNLDTSRDNVDRSSSSDIDGSDSQPEDLSAGHGAHGANANNTVMIGDMPLQVQQIQIQETRRALQNQHQGVRPLLNAMLATLSSKAKATPAELEKLRRSIVPWIRDHKLLVVLSICLGCAVFSNHTWLENFKTMFPRGLLSLFSSGLPPPSSMNAMITVPESVANATATVDVCTALHDGGSMFASSCSTLPTVTSDAATSAIASSASAFSSTCAALSVPTTMQPGLVDAVRECVASQVGESAATGPQLEAMLKVIDQLAMDYGAHGATEIPKHLIGKLSCEGSAANPFYWLVKKQGYGSSREYYGGFMKATLCGALSGIGVVEPKV